jgi:hypothetical protein
VLALTIALGIERSNRSNSPRSRATTSMRLWRLLQRLGRLLQMWQKVQRIGIELGIKRAKVFGTCLIKAPIGSPAMDLALQICLSKDWSTVRWGAPHPGGRGTRAATLRSATHCLLLHRSARVAPTYRPTASVAPGGSVCLALLERDVAACRPGQKCRVPPSCLYERLKGRHLRRTDRGSDAAAGRGVGSRGDIPE